MNCGCICQPSTSRRVLDSVRGSKVAAVPDRAAIPDRIRTTTFSDISAPQALPQHVPLRHSQDARELSFRSAPASLSRTVVSAFPPTGHLSRAICQRPIGGAVGIIFASAMLLVLHRIFKAILRLTIYRLRNCGSCGGFGIERCSMCLGQAAIGWGGKWNHALVCPKCHGTRFTMCETCHGMTARPMFKHITRRPTKNAKLPPPPQVGQDGRVRQPPPPMPA
jgi:hypothetical protein